METQITKQIKKALYKSNYECGRLKKFMVAECSIKIFENYSWRDEGIVDFIGVDNDKLIYCYEIKQSVGDLKTKNKLTFVGNYNYLVIPKGFYNRYQKEITERLSKDLIDIGIIEVDTETGKLLYIRKAKRRAIDVNVKEQIFFRVITSMAYKLKDCDWCEHYKYQCDERGYCIKMYNKITNDIKI